MIPFRGAVSLKQYNTFRIDSVAKKFVEATSEKEIKLALLQNPLPNYKILGEGSNILLTQNMDALVIKIANKGIEIVEQDEHSITVEVQAGHNWHDFVLWCLRFNYGGIENLALIPGSVGAAPIQNIGAYGVSVEDVFVSCRVLNSETLHSETISKSACQFGYRNSIFKQDSSASLIITSIRLRLSKPPHNLNLSYKDVEKQLGSNQKTIRNVANAIVQIRSRKLPDQKKWGTAGSFFKNPIVSVTMKNCLLEEYPNMPYQVVEKNQCKLSAAWLIDIAGYKGFKMGNAGVYPFQPLVLVNLGNAKGSEIHNLANRIATHIKYTFGICLEKEVCIW